MLQNMIKYMVYTNNSVYETYLKAIRFSCCIRRILFHIAALAPEISISQPVANVELLSICMHNGLDCVDGHQAMENIQ